MPIEIAHSEKFPYELANVPKDIRDACFALQQKIKEQIIVADKADPPKIKKLTKYKGLWRVKIKRDYRLVYLVSPQGNRVVLVMIDHRKKIYERLDIQLNEIEEVGIVNDKESLHEEVDIYEKIREVAQPFNRRETREETYVPDNPLPTSLNPDLLDRMDIPRQYHDSLIKLKTEEDLICDDTVPDIIRERIMEFFWPSHIQEVSQKPVRIANDVFEFEEAVEGKRKLESFLLRLDKEQKEFVTRFSSDSRPVGPWLLKGGPGSGKSTVTLYCIKSLLESLGQQQLFQADKPPRILYTTFTNSLVKVSEHLLGVLGTKNSIAEVDVRTVDSMAFRHLPPEFGNLDICVGTDRDDLVSEAIALCNGKIKNFSFSDEDRRFLIEEIDWVIIGQDLDKVKQYLAVDRSGRGRALGQIQRQHLWILHEQLIELLRDRGQCLFSERLRAAAKSVTPSYDYVFIDEAQDLKPVAIRFLMGLCENRKNVYLTADVNQSIWGYSFSWTKMAEDLDVRGRVKILRRNYRTTKEIWAGVMQLAPENDADEETLKAEAVYRGHTPIMARYDNLNQMKSRLSSFLFEALRQERTTPGSAAVLCPTRKEAESVYEMLGNQFKPKIMKSKEVDITWPGVKIITMHAAKGLEFPVVAVVGLEKGRLPLPVQAQADKEEHIARQQRLLFVACSRAMRRLIVFAHRSRPSPFAENLTDECWAVEEL